EYERAAQALKEHVMAALEPFIEHTITRWEGAALKTGLRASFLRSTAANHADNGDNAAAGANHEDDLARVIRRTVAAIAADAMSAFRSGELLDREFRQAVTDATNDPYREYRFYLYELLRRPGEENVFRTAGKPESRLFRLPLMPLLAGDNL